MRSTAGGLVETDLSEDGVLTIWMTSEETGNALDLAMTEALAVELENVNEIPEARCLLLRSSARHFCAGGNVKDMAGRRDLMAGTTTDIDQRLRAGLHRLPRAMDAIEIPTVAVVNGAAVGAGLDLALMCDLRVASTRAQFAESFLRLGLVSGIGGSWHLARIVGPAKALELTLTSEFVDADRALQLGMATSVVDPADLDGAALDLARALASQPPLATRMAKRLVTTASRCGLEDTLSLAASLQATLLAGDEHHLVVEQFLASRRAPAPHAPRS